MKSERIEDYVLVENKKIIYNIVLNKLKEFKDHSDTLKNKKRNFKYWYIIIYKKNILVLFLFFSYKFPSFYLVEWRVFLFIKSYISKFRNII